MKSNMIWATPVHSIVEISNALIQLNVSHTFFLSNKVPNRKYKSGFKQPLPVHVTKDFKDWHPESVNFISASYGELSLTNFPRFVPGPLESSLRTMLETPIWIEPKIKKMTAMDYVNQVAKPSLLNKIQTDVYRIQPYSLRKETQTLVLEYFTSKVSWRAVVKSLQRSFKTSNLITLLGEGEALRSAVAELKFKSVEQVSAETGIPTFELLYLSKERKLKEKSMK